MLEKWSQNLVFKTSFMHDSRYVRILFDFLIFSYCDNYVHVFLTFFLLLKAISSFINLVSVVGIVHLVNWRQIFIGIKSRKGFAFKGSIVTLIFSRLCSCLARRYLSLIEHHLVTILHWEHRHFRRKNFDGSPECCDPLITLQFSAWPLFSFGLPFALPLFHGFSSVYSARSDINIATDEG